MHVSGARIAGYQPPDKVDRKEGIGGQDVRRVYDRSRKTIDDRLADKRCRWSGGLAEMVGELAEERLARQVDEWLRS